MIRTGSQTRPWENGYCESFNSKLRDEFLNGEIFYSMKELRRTLSRSLQHDQATLLAGLQETGTGSWLTINMGHGEVETATRFPLLHSPTAAR